MAEWDGDRVIYLKPEFEAALNDDSFWRWFHRTWESTYDIPERIRDEDFILQYGMLGPPSCRGGTRVALLWELYPEMKRVYGHTHDDHKIAAMQKCYEECDLALVSSPSVLEFYPQARLQPIGIDTDLFQPVPGTPRAGAFWCGTDHPMKGLDAARRYEADTHSAVAYVFKGDMAQPDLAAAMSRHRVGLLTGMLRPLFLVEWEMLASGLVPEYLGCDRDHVAPQDDPRGFVFQSGWSRHQVKPLWEAIVGPARA